MKNNTWTLTAKNIRGIEHASATFESGVNTIEASNWQGKSSLIGALKTVMGISKPLRSGASEGSVTLSTPNTTHHVGLNRSNRSVIRSEDSDPLLTDPSNQEIARLFAVLDETNPIRNAVEQGKSLENLLLRPLDLEDIQNQISDLQREREQIESELDKLEKRKSKLTNKEQELATKEHELAELQRERAELDVDPLTDEMESKQDELSNKRQKRNRQERILETAKGTVEDLKTDIEETEAELDKLNIPDENPDLQNEISNLEDKLQTLQLEQKFLSDLRNINQQVFDENNLDLVSNVSRELTETQINCWVCGNNTTAESIEANIEAIDTLINNKRDEINQIKQEIDSKKAEQEDRKTALREKNRLEQQIRDYRDRLEQKQSTIQQTKEKIDELENEIEALEATVNDDVRELIDIESEIKHVEAEIQDLNNEIENLESKIEDGDTYREQKQKIDAEIEELRQYEDKKRQEINDRFESNLSEMIDRFEPGFGGGYLANFEIKLAREGRDTNIDELSEGERELLGIITALAGFETFNIDDITPIFLLDSIGSLSAENLELLIDYLEDRTELLITTAYPEQVTFESNQITPDNWDVVSQIRPADDYTERRNF